MPGAVLNLAAMNKQHQRSPPGKDEEPAGIWDASGTFAISV